jgi:uncharacterized protein YwqG
MNLIKQTEEKKRKVVDELMQRDIPNIQEFLELINITISIEPGYIEEAYLGMSKFGGRPDLPKSFEWPKHEGKFMTFFAQVNFQEIDRHPELSLIPEDGIIYFFVFLDSSEKEFFASKDLSEVSVLFFNGSEDKLLNQDFPDTLPEKYKIAEQPICFDLEYSVPCGEEDLCLTDKIFNFTEETVDRVYDLSDELNKLPAQMLGYPSCINAVPVDHWAGVYQSAISQNLIDHKLNSYERSETDFRRGWINLLSIDFLSFSFFEEISWSKGFWGIRREDLERLNFDNVILEFQNS